LFRTSLSSPERAVQNMIRGKRKHFCNLVYIPILDNAI
jgi:hypothetical protein